MFGFDRLVFKGEVFSNGGRGGEERGSLGLSASALLYSGLPQLSYKVLSNWGYSPVKETLRIGHAYQ